MQFPQKEPQYIVWGVRVMTGGTCILWARPSSYGSAKWFYCKQCHPWGVILDLIPGSLWCYSCSVLRAIQWIEWHGMELSGLITLVWSENFPMLIFERSLSQSSYNDQDSCGRQSGAPVTTLLIKVLKVSYSFCFWDRVLLHSPGTHY